MGGNKGQPANSWLSSSAAVLTRILYFATHFSSCFARLPGFLMQFLHLFVNGVRHLVNLAGSLLELLRLLQKFFAAFRKIIHGTPLVGPSIFFGHFEEFVR